MQQRIEEHPDFNTFRNNPIELLKVIKLLMHDPIQVQYPFVLMTDALAQLINVKQNTLENLIDYVKRFKQLKDVTKSYIGSDFLEQFIGNTTEYKNETDANKQQSMKDDAIEKWLAYLLVMGSDQAKYGSLTKGFQSQYSLNNDQYPKTIIAATDALSSHQFDQQFYDNKEKGEDNTRNNNKKKITICLLVLSKEKRDVMYVEIKIICYLSFYTIDVNQEKNGM